jgi:hypothetical protein
MFYKVLNVFLEKVLFSFLGGLFFKEDNIYIFL